jgi:hypothetical protein
LFTSECDSTEKAELVSRSEGCFSFLAVRSSADWDEREGKVQVREVLVWFSYQSRSWRSHSYKVRVSLWVLYLTFYSCIVVVRIKINITNTTFSFYNWYVRYPALGNKAELPFRLAVQIRKTARCHRVFLLQGLFCFYRWGSWGIPV